MKKEWFSLIIFFTINTSYGQRNFSWKTSSPEEQGMSSLSLINGINKIKQDSTNIHSLLVIKNDHIVLDAYFYPFQKNYVHDIASITKSVMSLLIGIAIDKGFIASEDTPILHYFPEYTERSDTLKRLRIKDLLNMTSGLQCSWDNGEEELQKMQESSDWIQFMFNLPFSSEPGKQFSYCSGNFYLLAEILQRVTKMKCHEFAKKYLFDLLGFNKTYWEENSKGVNHGWGDLKVSPYDLAKIGCMILNEGKWNKKQIVSSMWINKIKPLYYIHGTESYGYGWWLDSANKDEIQALGRGGQRLFILKDQKVVILTTGGGFNAGDMDDLVLESIRSYNKNENYSTELKKLVKTIQLPDVKRIYSDSVPSAILNKTFRLENNMAELSTIRFERKNKEIYLVLGFADRHMEHHPIEMDNQYKISTEHLFNLPVAIKSYWKNDKITVDYNGLSIINFYRLTFDFNNNILEVFFQDLTNRRNACLRGNAIK